MKKRIIALLTVVLICTLSVLGVSASEGKLYVIDEADVLTPSEEIALTEKLERLNKKYELDVVVLTVNDVDDSPSVYADDYYDDNGYGDNGLLLFVEVDDNERYVSTSGSCIDDIDIEDLGDEISSLLDERKYSEAFSALADFVDDVYKFDIVKSLLISVAIGLLIAFIVTSTMKGKLKSVRRQAAATNYVKAGSFNVTNSRDVYLYRTVTSRRRANSNSGGGTHTSSSGRSHGGGKI